MVNFIQGVGVGVQQVVGDFVDIVLVVFNLDFDWFEFFFVGVVYWCGL